MASSEGTRPKQKKSRKVLHISVRAVHPKTFIVSQTREQPQTKLLTPASANPQEPPETSFSGARGFSAMMQHVKGLAGQMHDTPEQENPEPEDEGNTEANA